MSGFDLAAFDLNAKGNEGAWINIAGPSGEALPLRFKVAGARSDRVLKVTEAADRRLREAIDAKKTSGLELDALQKARDEELLVAAVIDWRTDGDDGGPYLQWGGDQLLCTPDNARRVMTAPGFDWLVVQVVAASREARHFTTP